MSSPAGHPNARAQAQRNGNTYDPVDARYRPPFGPLVVQPTPPDRDSAASSTSVARPCHVDGTIRPPFTYRGSTAHVGSDARAGADQRSSEEISRRQHTPATGLSYEVQAKVTQFVARAGGINQSTVESTHARAGVARAVGGYVNVATLVHSGAPFLFERPPDALSTRCRQQG
jgi:hypothetical protein